MSPLLPTRPLGTHGPSITTVGFGAWAIGGGGWAFGWGPQDDADSIAAIRHAVERGVNWIDTAAVYGLGHSEEVVGRALAGCPPSERPLVFTKCGLRLDEQDRMAARDPRLAPRVDPREVRGVAAPARRRGDRPLPVPLARRDGTPVEDSWGEMARLVDEGKVRRGGRVQLRRRAARALRDDPARGHRSSRPSR